jgi:TP901-1 family phage major tail protein
MAAQKGRELLLKIHDGSTDFTDAGYSVVGGFKSNSFEMNGEAIDITNKDSGGFKELLEGGGNVSLSVSGDGVFLDDASFQRVHDHLLAQTHPDCKIVIPDFAEYTGKFAISTLSLSGNDGEAVTYNISLDSAGIVTVTAI